ncbi:MAG TPA: linear amide C-N hydrolase [Bacillota bacterium]|nr:linear amide C-N hydrolase [Bacillota bacterium]
MNRLFKLGFLIASMILFLCLLSSRSSMACSAFCIDKGGNLVVGRSYDWDDDGGMVVVNKKGQKKIAFRYSFEYQNEHNLARWTSKYGSIGFVQYGREINICGMNEAGLVVNETWLDETHYPSPDSRESLSVDQLVMYILDNYQSVDEIAAGVSSLRVRPTYNNFTKLHFFAIDATGNGIVIELLNGKTVIYRKEELPIKVLTNDTYRNSLAYIENPHTIDSSSLGRFANAASLIAKCNSGDAVSYAFSTLDAVSQGAFTKFKVVFDINNRKIYFKTLKNPNQRYFNFNSFDFSPLTLSKILDINAQYSGDVTSKFTDYSTAANEALISTSWRKLGNTFDLPSLYLISRYPETYDTGISMPAPSFPADHTAGVGNSVALGWVRPFQVEGKPLTYQLYLGTNQNFTGVNPIQIAAVTSEKPPLNFAGMGVVCGLGLVAPLATRKRFYCLLLMLFLFLGCMTGCGGGSHSNNNQSNNELDMTYTVNSLQPATTYYWEVVAMDADGNSHSSDVWTFTTK